MANDQPKIKLTEPQRLWLSAICSKLQKGERASARVLKVELRDKLPRDFDPSTIDSSLLRHEDQITLLGIGLIDPSSELVKNGDAVILSIREVLINNPEIESIDVSDVSRDTKLPEVEVAIIFKKLADIGVLHDGGSTYGHGVDGWRTIKVDKRTLNSYLKYESLEQILTSIIDNDGFITKKPPSKDFRLKALSVIILVITATILFIGPTLGMWIILLIELGSILLIAVLRGWVSDKLPQALDWVGSISSYLLALILAIYALQKPSDQNAILNPTPTPTATPTASATQIANANTQTQKEVIEEPNPQLIDVKTERTGSAFKGDVSVGVNAISFGGDPLRHTVNATVRSPGHKPSVVKGLEVNQTVTYKGKTDYEITLIEVDTFWAKFEVRRVDNEEKPIANVNRSPK
jgi:hypothetical protein